MADIMKLVREWEAKRQGKSPSEKLAQKNWLEWRLSPLSDRRKAAMVSEVETETKPEDGKLPWPGYNGGQQFRCDLCGTYFDTSAGIAKHQVYGCDAIKATEATEATPKTLPRCAVCGSYALYRENDGTVLCETCELKKVN